MIHQNPLQEAVELLQNARCSLTDPLLRVVWARRRTALSDLTFEGRWLYGVLAERDGKTRTWTIETTREAAEAALEDVPPEYMNPRVAKRWESTWIEGAE